MKIKTFTAIRFTWYKCHTVQMSHGINITWYKCHMVQISHGINITWY